MVPVALDHGFQFGQRDLLPLLIPNMLPAGDFFEDQQANLVATIQEMRGLRVMRGAYDIAG